MKALNLYAGLGGNRKLWDASVTAVEYKEDIAGFYKDSYPDDEVIVGDAHEFLLAHYKEFDFIWASPPCPTHSRARHWTSKGGRYDVVYPDMSLWQEIIFLQHHSPVPFVVENVVPYYQPLIPANIELDRHLFWCNFHVYPFDSMNSDVHKGTRGHWQQCLDINIDGYKFSDRTDKLLRNCINPQLGLHIFESAFSASPQTITQESLF